MGVVHRGAQVSTAGKRIVAIKRLAKTREHELGTQRLVQEGRLVFGLSHANICQVLDLAADAESVFVVMEYVDGVDLHTFVCHQVESGRLPETAGAVYAAREIARALGYAHRRRNSAGELLFLVHGDVSPRNILLSVEGDVKLTDFGIARAIGRAAPGSGVLGGTPGYIAPEVYQATPDHRADLYSLGSCLQYALTGVRPSSDGPSDVARLGDVSNELREIVRRSTCQDPAERYSSAEEMERALAVEIATHFPSFTPSDLGRWVRGCPRPSAAVLEPAEATRLTSLGQSTIAELSVVDSGQLFGKTVTASRPPRRRRWPAIAISLFVAFVAAVAGYIVNLASSAPSTIAEEVNTRARRFAAAHVSVPDTPRVTSAPRVHVTTSDDSSTSEAPTLPKPKAREPSTNTKSNDGKSGKARTRRERRSSKGTKRATVPEPQPKAKAYLTVTARPWGAVYVDGRRVANETPLVRYPLAPGKHSVRVFYPSQGTYSPRKTVRAVSGQSHSVSFRP